MDRPVVGVKIVAIVVLVVGITLLHAWTRVGYHHLHVVYRELYFIPLILSGIWFGLRGALATSLAITVLYIPIISAHWQGFSAEDLDKVAEVVLYNIVASILGVLRDAEIAKEREKTEAIQAMAATVAHQLNSPLFVVLGTAEMMQETQAPGSDTWEDAQTIMENARRMQEIVKRLANLETFQMVRYVGSEHMIDIDADSA